jgi:hypothetical protein
LYGFIAGSILSLGWSVVLLALCRSVQIPNSSSFPEVDFASKCIESDISNQSSPIGRRLFPLSNATTPDVQEQLEKTQIFVGVGEKIQHITIALEPLEGLVKGNLYK